MTTEQRLQRVENDFEVVKELLMSAARYAESAHESLDQVSVKLDRLTEAQTETEQQLRQTNLLLHEFIAHTNAQQAQTTQLLHETSAQQTQATQRLDEFIFQSQRLLSLQAERLNNAEGRLERLEAIAQRLDRNYEAQQTQFREFQITTQAALEHQERILDYLLRRDGDNP